MTNRFPLATSSWGAEEYAAMAGVIASGHFTMGEKVATFERDFARYTGSKYCVMVNSGSSANLLMTAALCYTRNERLKLQRGDEVIVPAVSWPTTYYPLHQYGLKLKFVDIDPGDPELRSGGPGLGHRPAHPGHHDREPAGQSE